MTFTVRDTSRDTERTCNTRAEAEETKQDMIQLGATPEDLEIIPPKESDGGEVDAEIVDMTEGEEPESAYDLPDKPPVGTDPLNWIPEEFQDTIDGTVAINRKGFEVLAHHYNVACQTELVERDSETVIHKATATTDTGEVYTAYGEAHSSEDKDEQLVRLSDTRAFKRAVSRATGVGMVAVSELQNEL